MIVNEFRVAIRSEDFDTTVQLYRDILGFEQIEDWSGGDPGFAQDHAMGRPQCPHRNGGWDSSHPLRAIIL